MPTKKSLKTDVATHFEFGENWAAYAESINVDKIREAEAGLLSLLDTAEIADRTFLDIGCGSGLHSLAALNLGAKSVTAIDIDPNSVATSRHTVAKHSQSGAFRCETGNVFDPPFDDDDKFDVVYSWGVLHHTGSMWEAIEKAIGLVAPRGRLVIAIYLKTPFSAFWKIEKRLFTSLPEWLRLPIVWVYCALCWLRILAKGHNPVSHIAEYEKNRGMSWYRDRIDWLGGYPYESASAQEIIAFVVKRGGKVSKALNTKPSIGLLGSGCAEYVFEFE